MNKILQDSLKKIILIAFAETAAITLAEKLVEKGFEHLEKINKKPEPKRKQTKKRTKKK